MPTVRAAPAVGASHLGVAMAEGGRGEEPQEERGRRLTSGASVCLPVLAAGSGFVRRAELRAFLSKLSKSIPDGVISGLIAYVDTDGDTKTLSQEEFLRMMGEEFLDTL